MHGYRISKWLRSSCPSSLLKHGHIEQTFQDHVQMPFEHLQGLGFHHCHRQAFPDLSHPQSKKVFPDVQAEPPVLQFLLCLDDLLVYPNDIQPLLSRDP